MLADDIAVAEKLKRGLGDGPHAKLCATIAAAHRFDLAEDFASAATQISNTNMAAFKNAATACRAPAPICWIEVPQSYRGNFADDNRTGEVGHWEDLTRVGILLEQKSEDGLYYVMHLIYKSLSAGVSICCFSLLVDLHPTNNSAARQRQKMGHASPREILSKKYSGEDLEAAVAMENLTCAIGNDYTDEMIGRVKANFNDGGATLMKLAHAEMENWNGELMFWLSALALINTRNLGYTKPVDVTKQNKLRKLRRKIPLLSYETCNIDKSRFRIEAADRDAATSRYGVRAHFVRGHFKMRRTGVFWWRPAVRGIAELGIKMKSYRVRHTDDAALAA